MARSRPDDENEDDDRPSRRNRDRNEDDEDERPSRRKRNEEDEDERPSRSSGSRRSRDVDDDAPVAKKLSILGVLSLIQGILALLVSFIPCIGAFAIIGGVIGLVLGSIGLLIAGKSNHGKGLPIAGIVVSIISMIIAGVWILFMAGMSTLSTSTNTFPTVTTSDTNKPPIGSGTVKVEAAKLLKEYADDEDKANKDYKGKTLEITGLMTTVKNADKQAIVVQMQIKSGMEKFVEIRLTPEASKLASDLKKGQKATFKGTCTGIQDDEFILVENASIVK